jgi:hypothetical protein
MEVRKCKVSGKSFEITDEDLAFYEKMNIPAPTLCPEERQRRRLSWRNERNLYKRICSGSGKQILSVYEKGRAAFPVYDPEYWHSDNWDPKEYGRNFDFTKPFFPQFEALMNVVPQLARSVVKNQNCEFVNQCGWCKNCYLIFEADYDESCWYSCYIFDSRFCSDCAHITNCELCYECVDCTNCYELKFSQNSKTCHDSWFLKNCIGCSNCFGCVNLRNKQYYFLNQSCTKEEYEEKLKGVVLSTFAGLQKMRKDFQVFAQKYPHKFLTGAKNEDSVGEYLNNTQRCQECYDANNAQDCKWVYNSRNVKNVYDMMAFGSKEGVEFCCDNHELGAGVQNVIFSDQIWMGCHDIMYSKLCVNNSRNCLGCVGLKHAEYCILNKQYTKDEYIILRDKIIEHMKQTSEWGEFFPTTMSPVAYNETVAQEYFPITKEEALKNNWKWREEDKKNYQPASIPFPETIAKTEGDVVIEIFACTQCKKNYQIQRPELKFYRTMGLPIPHKCFECRHKDRMNLRNPRTLFDRTCTKCSTPLKTTFSPDKPEPVTCEKCFGEEAN